MSPGRDVSVAESAPVSFHVWEDPRVSVAAMGSTGGLVGQEPVALGAPSVSGWRTGAWVGRLSHPISVVRVIVLTLAVEWGWDASLGFSRRPIKGLESTGVESARSAGSVQAHVFRAFGVLWTPQAPVGVDGLAQRPSPSPSNHPVASLCSHGDAGVILYVQVVPCFPPARNESCFPPIPGGAQVSQVENQESPIERRAIPRLKPESSPSFRRLARK